MNEYSKKNGINFISKENCCRKHSFSFQIWKTWPYLTTFDQWIAHTCEAMHTCVCFLCFSSLCSLLLVVRLLFVYIFNEAIRTATREIQRNEKKVRSGVGNIVRSCCVKYELESLNEMVYQKRWAHRAIRIDHCCVQCTALLFQIALSSPSLCVYTYFFLLSAYAIVTYKNLVVWDVLPKEAMSTALTETDTKTI